MRWRTARRGRPSARRSAPAGRRRGSGFVPASPRRSKPTAKRSRTNGRPRPNDVGGRMTEPDDANADDITRRAQEIKARAERITEDVTDSEALRDELDRLDEALRQLDDEQ